MHDTHEHNKTTDLYRQPITKNLRCGRVTLHPGQDVGEHIPYKREEIVVVVSGTGSVVIEGERRAVKPGDAIFIAENKKHNVINDGKEDLVYVYVVSIF